MDGSSLQFRSLAWNANLTAERGGGAAVVAVPDSQLNGSYATFKVWRIDETTFNFRVFNQQFISVWRNGAVLATAATPGPAETFQIVRNAGDKNRVRIRAPNGRFLQVKRDHSVTADHGESTSWGDDDPSVFAMTNVGDMHGEFQICNGYGTGKAAAVLRNHWNTFIVEEDFEFIASNGLNAVRIPVGWWIASDPNPPAPYVGGSLDALDKAFKWAEKYKLGVIIDLHAAPGSQNGYEHSASRDGSQEWGTTDASIALTVQVIDFLASRYAASPSLLAMGLMNEPMAPGVTLDSLVRYYRAGYAAVRRHTPRAYVVMSSRLAGGSDELPRFAGIGGLPGAVIDVHYYVFNSSFTNLTAQQNIDFIKTNYAADLRGLTRQNGPLSFVGEWVAVWNVPNATKAEYQRLAQVQMEVYGQATFGWAYWTLKNVNNYWSLEWMIKNGYISLKH
ncbi:probable glucan 1,3-beta-glucosidase A [Panicum hallii]|uniref:probable glucan 1,3-beta-glucosidase A n=1 Tax=Panicum hallii TaxID=206008 RepID=UPI000DF4EF4E|nr:probable glucan 1,3-beta-glucosidase A [Panicum hallii]